jgi:hypothetical protein
MGDSGGVGNRTPAPPNLLEVYYEDMNTLNKKKCFLGGTCNNSQWREALIPMLKIDYFNPVVKDWTPEWSDVANYLNQ